MYKILIVDNDLETVTMMEHYLKREGHRVFSVYSVRDALLTLEKPPPDMLIIDTSSSALDGIGLCQRLRATSNTAHVPIILTGQDTRIAVTEALGAGGDDYIPKPVAPRELAARVRAHLRRVSGGTTDSLPTLQIVHETQTVLVNKREVVLTQVEFELLNHLCRKPNQLHRTQDLLTEVWQYPRGSGDAALVRNHVRNLRRKIEEDPERPAIIQSRHGRGYSVRASIRFENKLGSTI